MTDPKRKYYEKRANVLIKNLHSRHFEACYCADKAEALKKALEWIPAGSSVGWGGAMSAQQIGLLDTVRTGDYRALDRERAATPEERKAIMKQCLGADVFITGANALSLDGQMVNIDGNGNRVAAIRDRHCGNEQGDGFSGRRRGAGKNGCRAPEQAALRLQNALRGDRRLRRLQERWLHLQPDPHHP